jgi:dTMP kinase
LSDRFVDASYAYQGGGRGIDFSRIKAIEAWSLADFKPDLTILLDMSVEEGLARTRQRGAPDRFETEKLDFYESIRQAYLRRAKEDPARMKVIDAAPAVEQVQQSLHSLLSEYL